MGAYEAVFDLVVLPALHAHRPDMIIVPSGFDAGAHDPLGRQMMTSEGYRSLTKKLMAAARAVIEEYVAACRARSAPRLKAVFHPAAVMNGYLMDKLLIGSPEPFYDAVQNAPADPSGGGYLADIASVEVSGRIASVTLKEQGFLGLRFTNYFHLLDVGGRWQIVSKTFTSE